MPSGGQNCLQVRTTVLERQGGEREGRRRRRKKRRKNTKEKEKKKKKNLPWVWDLQGKNHDHIWYSSLHIIGTKYLPIDWLTGNEELFGKGESPRLAWTDSPSACLCLRYALLSWAVRTACTEAASAHTWWWLSDRIAECAGLTRCPRQGQLGLWGGARRDLVESWAWSLEHDVWDLPSSLVFTCRHSSWRKQEGSAKDTLYCTG